MITIVRARISAPSARLIAAESDDIELAEGVEGDVNWGRYKAQTALNADITNATNKRVMRELFRDNGVPMPRLLTLDEAYEEAARGVTILGRPDRHWKGRGFWKIENVHQFERSQQGTTKKKPATHFMEFLDPERAPKEFRAHIFKGRSLRISEKAHVEFHKYTTIKPTLDNVDHIREAAKKALAATGLDFGAVDVLANESEAWVLEVNAAPGLGGTMPSVYANAFLRWKNGDI